ncbi:MAG: Smr/MutS family protein [Clostridiales bacterium]|nr:Smr/MutS family protein [Clostridiales bacterium]HAW15164.1 hypothetical protein [Clostridiales bacterium]
MTIIDLETGRPDTGTAMKKLYNQIYLARSRGAREAKIIHGYGSSGTGGAIKRACLTELSSYRRRGIIKAYCPGEQFGPMSQGGRDILTLRPELKKDKDWARCNDGITVVVLK